MTITNARLNMVTQQLAPFAVTDKRVLRVFDDTPREHFVPKAYQQQAYADLAIPLAHEQIMFHPKYVATMLQALAIQPTDTILEIGTGSGYTTALLAQLGQSVYSLDIQKDFTQQAREKLDALALTNITLTTEDAMDTINMPTEYVDVMFISTAMPELPMSWSNRLNLNGRIIAIINAATPMHVVCYTRQSKSILLEKRLFEMNAPNIITSTPADTFIF